MTAISMVSRARIEVFVSEHFKSPAWGASELYGSIAKNITDASDEIIIGSRQEESSSYTSSI